MTDSQHQQLHNKVHCLRLELPKSVADDVLPELHAMIDSHAALQAVVRAAEEVYSVFDTLPNRGGGICGEDFDRDVALNNLRAALAAVRADQPQTGE